jgi:hypothetical protein
MRFCKTCNHERPESDYYPHRNSCRECLVAQNRRNREKKRLSSIAYLLNNWRRAV